MLSKKIEKSLNDQILYEASASNQYLAMASWCENNGFDGSAKFMYKQAEEERGHMLKLYHYVNDSGGHAITPEVSKPAVNYNSLHELFETALKAEIKVTASIKAMVDDCLKSQEYSTFNFLSWYVDEQFAEENMFSKIVDKIKYIGSDNKGLYMVDGDIAKMIEEED